MKIWIVTKALTDDDGWSKGEPRIVKVFFDKQKSYDFITSETGLLTGKKYGYADQQVGNLYYRWFSQDYDVEE